jgi:hypothetical protein
MQARLATWSRWSGFRRQSKRARSMALAGQNAMLTTKTGIATRDVARRTAGKGAGVSEWSACFGGGGWRSCSSEVLCCCFLPSCLGSGSGWLADWLRGPVIAAPWPSSSRLVNAISITTPHPSMHCSLRDQLFSSGRITISRGVHVRVTNIVESHLRIGGISNSRMSETFLCQRTLHSWSDLENETQYLTSSSGSISIFRILSTCRYQCDTRFDRPWHTRRQELHLDPLNLHVSDPGPSRYVELHTSVHAEVC